MKGEIRPHKTIGLVSAVGFEASSLVDRLFDSRKQPKYAGNGPGSIMSARHPGGLLLYTASGIGAVNAASAITRIIELKAPDIIIYFGIGGAYPKAGLKVGDIAIAECEVFADLGVRLGNGIQGMDAIGIPLVKTNKRKYFNEFPLDLSLARKAVSVASGLPNVHAASGTFLTVSAVTSGRTRAMHLRNAHEAVCENMEGAAAAQVCTAYGVSMVELRGISNIVGPRDTSKWDKYGASEACQRAVLGLLDKLLA